MGLTDCPKCWSDPCVCGHEYMDWTEEELERQVAVLKEVLRYKQEDA